MMKTIYSRPFHFARIVCMSCIACIVNIVCISFIASAQVTDDFSDGNFTKNPAWTGDTTQFEINSSGQLHLLSAGSDTSVLFTRYSAAKNMEWRFWMKLSFNTSSNNHAKIYLAADTTALSSIVNACFLQAGGGDDSLFIMKQSGASVIKLFRFKSYRMLHTTNTLRFKITCDDSGRWEAMIDTTGGYNYFSDGTFYDDSGFTSHWFGFMCRYTSSNATKFYFDDLYIGPIRYDTVSPEILAVEATTAKVLQITCSEAVQKEGAENPDNYLFPDGGFRLDSVKTDVHHPELAFIFLHDSLVQGTIGSLGIRNITDLSGNQLPDTIVPFYYYLPKAYDVVIHEIMSDPDPPVGLPDGEFAELYNRSEFTINLQGWTFDYGSYTKTFPSVKIPAKGYLLVVKDSVYRNFAKCAVLFTSSTSLSNEGTTLVLKDPEKHVIHSVSYNPDWYRGSFKEDGGWSLEMTDSSNPCGCAENWEPSRDASGGTPGRTNSSEKDNPDENVPVLLRAVISDSAVLQVTFSESMDSISLLSPGGWTIHFSDEAAHPDRVVPVSPEFSGTMLKFNQPFIRGVTYTLNISGEMKDCAGNRCDTARRIRFAIPDAVTPYDVVVNEILSNPASGGSRFVELYNRSEKIIDLQTLVMANRDNPEELQANAVPLTSGGYLLFPGDYIAMTSGVEDICARYRPASPEAIAAMSGFPVFGDDTGTVVIARKDDMTIIDRMRYTPEMHYPLLATAEGVSLERTHPDLPAAEASNWHSAAETAGYATPGYQNSHWSIPEGANGEVTVQPPVFSPDNDGRDDLLMITIRENDADYAVNIIVYNSGGQLVRQLANHVLLGSEGVFIWDGMTAERNKAPLGFYVLFVELTRPNGTVRIIKKTVVVAGKL
ncbi:MAG: lamin tail domain-containing protein [Bacteroidetes bacterium]|nr:lamin tail domain-containing protein [Bacteroidota bacterium]